MHKSGTTLISRILHESGISMGEFDPKITYDGGNQFESSTFQEVNRKLLKCEKMHSLDIREGLDENYEDEKAAELIASLVEKESTLHKDWGFKDPRTCLTYKYWEKCLPDHRCISVFRSPMEVWQHYRKKVPLHNPWKRFAMGQKALRSWYQYNVLLLKYIEAAKVPHYIINYSTFMGESDAVSRLSRYVGRPLQDSREPALYRARTRGVHLVYDFSLLLRKWVWGEDVEALYQRLNEITD